MTTKDLRNALEDFTSQMKNEEKAPGTIRLYRGQITRYLDWLEAHEIEEPGQEDLLAYKKEMQAEKSVSYTNNSLTILNKYMGFCGVDAHAKQIKTQSKGSNNETLSRSDYERLLRWSKKMDKERLYLIMKTLAGTGIRIEELKYITVEAVQGRGAVTVTNKGKTREIIIGKELRKLLRKYCKDNDLTSGIIFHGRGDKPLDPSRIWRELKEVAGQARVKKSKVHAHSFRHLFASEYMKLDGASITELADLLGHSSLETTRIYTRTSTSDKAGTIARMGL